jgi:hypothetical protein
VACASIWRSDTLRASNRAASSLDYFYMSAWLTLALIALCFLLRRPKVVEKMAVAAE